MKITRHEMLISLSERQNHRCAYCGFTMWLPLLDAPLPVPERDFGRGVWRAYVQAHPRLRLIVPRHPSNSGVLFWPRAVAGLMCTPDHVHPAYLGGLREDKNLVACCWIDNGALKAHRKAEHAAAIIRARVEAGTHPHQVYQKTGIWAVIRGPTAHAYMQAALRAATQGAPGA